MNWSKYKQNKIIAHKKLNELNFNFVNLFLYRPYFKLVCGFNAPAFNTTTFYFELK